MTVQRFEVGNKNIPPYVGQHTKSPPRKQAHLVFANTKANAEKPKEPVFCQRSDGITNRKR